MALSPEQALKLKTALYRDAQKYDYVVPGFRLWKRQPDGKVVPVPGVGVQCRAMIRTYQERNKLVIDGTFNSQTQKKLVPPPPPPKVTPGDKIANKAHALLALAPKDYSQRRPCATTQDEFDREGGDCSCLAMICLSAAVPGYTTGYGNTWSLVAQGRRVSRGDALPGDLVFYGPRQGDPTHVAVYVGNGFVVSHGHQDGPYLEAVDYRNDRIDIRRYA